METVWLIEVLTGPEVASVHDQLTVTFPLFQPLPLGSVRLTNVITGFVASRLMVNGDALLDKPARLVHDPLKVAPLVSVFKV